MADPPKPFLTTHEVAGQLGRSVKYVRLLVGAGELRQLNPGSSRPQFDTAAVKHLLERFRLRGWPVFPDLYPRQKPRRRKPAA